MKWYELSPEDARNIDARERPDLDPPLTQDGEVCPWPWDTMLEGGALGMYHCGYCGEMVVAGMRHPDYR